MRRKEPSFWNNKKMVDNHHGELLLLSKKLQNMEVYGIEDGEFNGSGLDVTTSNRHQEIKFFGWNSGCLS
jgi:hypothetical protein